MTSELIEQLENALHISEGHDFKIRADFVREIIAALRKPEGQAVAVMHHESTGWVQWLENPRTIPDRAALYVSSPAPSGYVMVPREPTGAMIQAGERFDAEWKRKSIGVFGGATVGDIYRAMLAAIEDKK